MSESRFKYLEYWVEKLKTRPRLAFTPWTTWTPTVAQSGSVAVTVDYARYCILEKLCQVQVKLSVTAAGTAGNPIIIGGQPTAIRPANTGTNAVIGSALVTDVSVTNYGGASVVALAAAGWRFVVHNATGYLGANPSFALANGDLIGFVAMYEVP